MGRRGPKPNRELMLARAVQAILALPKESRPTKDEIANLYGVSKRQVQAAYAKHEAQVVAEHGDRLATTLTDRLNARDEMTRADRQRHDEQRDARIEYEQALLRHRKTLVRKRSRKPKG